MPADFVMIEIQVTELSFLGVASRLVLIRNVDFVIEQQKLQTRAMYERKLTNTLSHELLTPLNCIINLSEPLMEETQAKVDAKKKKGNKTDSRSVEKLEKLMEEAQHYQLIWSSGKILEYTILSIINRQ